MNNTTIKAVRATILLGNIELDVFQLPDGCYRYSKTDIETSLGYEPTRRAYRDFLKSKDPKALQAKELSTGNTTLKYMSKTYTLVTQEEVTLFWGFQAQNGNQEAFALIMACVAEALERRADSAFNIQRTEEERNERLTSRLEGILTRRTLTDSIKDWLTNHENNASDNTKRFIYANCSDCLNAWVLGAKAKKAKELLGVAENSLLRDALPVKTLKELEFVERMASRYIDEDNLHPLEACKLALETCKAKIVGIEA